MLINGITINQKLSKLTWQFFCEPILEQADSGKHEIRKIILVLEGTDKFKCYVCQENKGLIANGNWTRSK